MKFLSILICGWLALVSANAQPGNGLVFAKSQSGQFIARSGQNTPLQAVDPGRVPVAGGWAFLLNSDKSLNSTGAQLQLEPPLLVVTCERLKRALLVELGFSDQWRGKIDLLIDSSIGADQEPALTAIWQPGGWSYELVLPKTIKSERLLRWLVHTMLLEIANRNSSGESAEIPLWLAEGMAEHLQACNLPTFVIQPRTALLGNRVQLQGLENVRTQLRHNPPLAFQDLSWPTPEMVSGNGRQYYSACAQLFVYELLRLKGGRNCLRQMLTELPQHMNWQTAFLRAFHADFPQLVDVEKWWSLVCVNFTTHNAMQVWSRQESWRRLQDTLDIPVQVHLSPERLPTAAAVTLQEVIQQWNKTDEEDTLRRALSLLTMLRPRLAPEAAVVADAYASVLDNYLRTHSRRFLRLSAARKKAVCRQLNSLDAKCAVLRSQSVDRPQEQAHKKPEQIGPALR